MAARAIIIALLFGFISMAMAQFGFFSGLSSGGIRDQRSNTGNVFNPGPVVFPMTNIGSETSGVRVGASGYGFVPPGSRGGIGPHGAGPNAGLPYYPGLTLY